MPPEFPLGHKIVQIQIWCETMRLRNKYCFNTFKCVRYFDMVLHVKYNRLFHQLILPLLIIRNNYYVYFSEYIPVNIFLSSFSLFNYYMRYIQIPVFMIDNWQNAI